MTAEANRLSDDEFRRMLELIRRYGTYDVDQFDQITLDTPFGALFVDIGLAPVSGGGYRDLTHLIEG